MFTRTALTDIAHDYLREHPAPSRERYICENYLAQPHNPQLFDLMAYEVAPTVALERLGA
ncbi:hypothetical protein [Nocardioides massiliensis]|uniref:Uncharacterized protein n=1 Tax=Nocardioides massiliensis TaxID=1325935 RepID=A0ABT9NLD8_9ACTN|nr:hypothetical protein [Nocardioides massiliensis]MDP9821042.1 hypothetical protein [Nocardioides massiliensis]